MNLQVYTKLTFSQWGSAAPPPDRIYLHAYSQELFTLLLLCYNIQSCKMAQSHSWRLLHSAEKLSSSLFCLSQSLQCFLIVLLTQFFNTSTFLQNERHVKCADYRATPPGSNAGVHHLSCVALGKRLSQPSANSGLMVKSNQLPVFVQPLSSEWLLYF